MRAWCIALGATGIAALTSCDGTPFTFDMVVRGAPTADLRVDDVLVTPRARNDTYTDFVVTREYGDWREASELLDVTSWIAGELRWQGSVSPQECAAYSDECGRITASMLSVYLGDDGVPRGLSGRLTCSDEEGVCGGYISAETEAGQ